MNTVVRWNPFREMVEFKNLMNGTIDRPFRNAGYGWTGKFGPDLAIDILEEDEEYMLKASVPGMNPDDLDITYHSDVLTIKGEVRDEREIDEERYYLRERRFGSFSRSVRIPSVNADGIEADYDSGVLTVKLPKLEEIKPKKIKVAGPSNIIEGELENA